MFIITWSITSVGPLLWWGLRCKRCFYLWQPNGAWIQQAQWQALTAALKVIKFGFKCLSSISPRRWRASWLCSAAVWMGGFQNFSHRLQLIESIKTMHLKWTTLDFLPNSTCARKQIAAIYHLGHHWLEGILLCWDVVWSSKLRSDWKGVSSTNDSEN